MQYAIFFVCNIKAKGKRAVKSAMGAIEGREVKGVEGMGAWGQAELKHTHTHKQNIIEPRIQHCDGTTKCLGKRL